MGETRPEVRRSIDMIDRISNLPNHILSLILSFLPTKYAVATTILSHRWTDIWTTTPVLQFDYEDDLHKDNTNFMYFLERVFSRYSWPSIQKFRFYYTRNYSMDENFHRMIDLVYTAVSHRIVEVDILFLDCIEVVDEIDLWRLPWGSLEVLKIQADVYVHIPSGCFGNLKKFHILLKYDVDNDLTSKLFSSLPQLEELKLELGDIGNCTNVNIVAPILKVLYVYLYDAFQEDHGGFQEIQKLYVLVDAPALEYFTLIDEVLASYTFKNLSATVQAKIGVGYIFETYDNESALAHANRAVKLFTGLSSAKSLLLQANTMKVLNFAYHGKLPLLHGLTKLELVVGSYHQNLLLHILNSTPNLEILVLSTRESMDVSLLGEPDCMVALPTCPLLHLKKIVMIGSLDSKGVEWLKHIIRNAKLHLNNLRVNFIL